VRRKTLLIHLNPAEPDREAISRAAESLRKGGLVAFPTETVYGLGADALNAEAVRKIFAAKGRPLDNPIIVHVAGPDDLGVLTDDVPPEATMLIRQFWPGPLTLIFKKSGQVPGAVTGGQDTVAVRMPRNAIALALVRASGRPIAAPSANLSGHPSPTTAGHVLDDLGGKIDIILDGGPVEVGIESTVLDLSQHPPVILRPGAVTREDLRPLIGEVVAATETGLLRRSPGTRYRHYSPRARVTLVGEADQETMGRLAASYAGKGRKVGLLTRCPCSLQGNVNIIVRSMPQDLKGYARQMFAVMRELDEMGIDEMIIEGVEERDMGAAIMDRLRRAASR
jgi:L-threonylcarbamoyladenylate synthase